MITLPSFFCRGQKKNRLQPFLIMVLLSLTSFSLVRATLVLEVKGTITQGGSPVESQYQVIISNLNKEVPTRITQTPSADGPGTYKNGWFNLFNSVADDGDQIQVEVKSAEGQKLVSTTATYSSGTSMTVDLVLESEPAPPESAWSTSLVATSLNTEVAPQTLVMGVDPDATVGFDAGPDQSAPPMAAAPVFLDIRFPIDAGIITALSKNMLPAADSLEYTFNARADINSFVLSWDKTAFPTTFTSVVLKETASGTSINMRDQASATYDKGTYNFKILLQSTTSIEIDLQPGWNMISIPGTPSNTSPESLKPGASSQILLPLYRWNPSRFTYEAVSELKSGEGYWLLTLAPEGETISIALNPAFSQTLSLSAGWNMIGGLATTVSFTDPQETPDNVILPPAYSWDAARFTYAQASALKAGFGYWVLSLQPCQLSLVATTIAGAPSILARQPDGQLDLHIGTLLRQKRLSIGWHRNSDQNRPINELDVVLPPVSPNSGQDQIHFLNAGYRLQQDTQALSTDSNWQLELRLTDNSRISWDANQLPIGMSMLMDNIDLRKIDQTILPAGQHLLSFRLVPIVELPVNSSVGQNYPNPFNPETWIPYQLNQASEVSLSVYSSNGTLVRQIDLGHQPAGHYRTRQKAVYWDGRNANGESVSSGVYFYQLTAGDYRQMRKMVILK